MPWTQVDSEAQKLAFIRECQRKDQPISAVCKRFGISRKSGHKWLGRFAATGALALDDRSRARHTQPHALPKATEKRLIELRLAHPTWGPRKLKARLHKLEPDLALPATSTIGTLLKKQGLIVPRRKRRHFPAPERVPANYSGPNAVWCIDFKGHFKLTSGLRVDPLTVTDGYSRFLLCCEALRRPTTAYVQPVFVELFRKYGLPLAIRSDNGPPFASRGLAGLTRLSAWWMQLGIRLQRIEPGKPQQNGRHERMHRTMKAEAMKPPRASFVAQQRVFNAFQREYNDVRPHDGIGLRTPAELYELSPRPYPRHLQDLSYPDDYLSRAIRTTGCLMWRGLEIFVSETLIGQRIGLKPVADGVWIAYFADLPIGVLDEHETAFFPDVSDYFGATS